MATLGGEETHPSQYLKATDLDYGSRVVTISGGDWQTVGDDRKVVLRFAELDKGLVLNKINTDTISAILRQQEIQKWRGGVVELYSAQTEFKHQVYDVIRVRAPQGEPEQVPEEVPF